MSIKKLFDSTNKATQYTDFQTEKQKYSPVESSRNAEQLFEKQETFTPAVDYSNPEKFVFYGSAELYYKGALDRISDYYPYDGSLAEQNAFYNKLLPVEKYIFDKKYPRTTGYATISAPVDGHGWGPLYRKTDGYGLPNQVEYITFKGGPHTGSQGTSLREQSPTPNSSKPDRSNIYDESIYETAGLPSDYGKGTRQSNLHADFDIGTTVEFWLKTGSMDSGYLPGSGLWTEKQVIFDWWNQEERTSDSYGRIKIELTSSTDYAGNALKPFIVTVMSGASTTQNFISLGSDKLHYEMSDWKHYAISIANSGSHFNTKLYVNGKSDEQSKRLYDLGSSFQAYNSARRDHFYNSQHNLQGWWRLNNYDFNDDLGFRKDSSGKGRHAKFDSPTYPAMGTLVPSIYINGRAKDRVSSGWNSTSRPEAHLDIGTSALWNSIIGTEGTKKMTLAAWIYPQALGGGNLGRIFDFAYTDIAFFIGSTASGDYELRFWTRWNGGSSVQWQTDSLVANFHEWVHVAVTYDATNSTTGQTARIYVNGVEHVATQKNPWPGGEWDGIAGGTDCFIGNVDYSFANSWDGFITDAAIWDSVLTEEEISAIYSATAMPSKPDATVAALNNKNAIGRIGALQAPPVGATADAYYFDGAGKLSGSMDEFRFWKVERDAAQIAENYFDRVGGGTNTDISNTTLGVYFKFNEGITGTSTLDSVVSDYSGRLSNGVWTGYKTTSRNTGSAMVSASAAPHEYADPIIRTTHPDYVSLRTSLLKDATYYDSTNHSAFINHAPSWVIETHEDDSNENLKIISHLVGSYFDRLYLLSKEFPKFKHASYPVGSAQPPPFARHLPESLGLYVPDIFIDATVQEKLMNRNSSKIFENDITEIKNLIYQNLYNNLANIYKAKGTEKAFKNVLRCFNIDDELVQLKVYSDNTTYDISNNLKQIISKNKSANFNRTANSNAVVYQRKQSTNADSRGYLSGSAVYRSTGGQNERYYGFTAESDIIFPRFFTSKKLAVDRSNTQVSLFGVVQPKSGSLGTTADNNYKDGINTTIPKQGTAASLANFQVYAIRDNPNSKNVYFKLESSGSENPFPTLTSSLFNNVYDENRWNLSVRLKPDSMGLAGLVSGSNLAYTLIFRGINSFLDTVKNSFEVSASVSYTNGLRYLTNHKRMYAGALRNNLTGAVIHGSDVKVSNVKYWTKFIENSNLDLHLKDIDNSGVSGSYKNIAALDTTTDGYDILNKDTLALEWNFDQVSTSDSGGNFVVQDFSSGSALIRNNLGWVGKATGYQHTGYGHHFEQSSTNVVDLDRVNSYKFIDPEEVVASDMIQILTDDDELLGYDQTIPNYVLSAEKSMYAAISNEMLQFFAGIVDFNNLIGEPVNRYRANYKDLEKLKESFFLRVSDTKDVEKYVNYYKWFDSAITEIFSQLAPASSNFIEGVSNTIESHVLERSKYRTPFPTLEAKQPDPEGALYGYSEKTYPYETGFSTLPSSPRKTDKHVDYWKARAERTAPEISSGDATIDAEREKIRIAINSVPTLTASRESIVVSTKGGSRYNQKKYAKRNFGKNYGLDINKPNARTLRGGVNFTRKKNFDLHKIALYPGGPIDKTAGRFVPQNILLSFVKDFQKIVDFKDPLKIPSEKIKRIVPVDYGRHHDDKNGYYHVDSEKMFPFNIISSSVSGGYQTEVQNALGLNLEITNLHNDIYGDDMEKPMQGIFTEHNVGGNQHRHAPLNKGTDDNNNRPEAWRILLGACTRPSGAIGMVGADYPMTPSYTPPAGANDPYPHAVYPRATYYRDKVAKSPVNFKNIRIADSVKLGNYIDTYQIVHTVGASSNPRQFIENTPVLPSNVFQGAATSSTSVRTFLDIRPSREYYTDTEHFNFVSDYNVGYLTGTTNKSVIKNRFSSVGGIETMTPGYTDFRADEFSVYNVAPWRNLTVLRPSQGPSGTLPAVDGAINSAVGIRVNDIHNEDYGLRSHLARHTARFGRDSLHLTDDQTGVTYDELPGFHKVHRNNLDRPYPIYGYEHKLVGPYLNNNANAEFYPGAGVGKGNIAIQVGKQNQMSFDATYAYANNQWVKFTWSCWVRSGDNWTDKNTPRFFEFGYGSISGPNQKPIHMLERLSNGTLRYQFYTTNGNNANSNCSTDTVDTPLTGSGWKHIAVTFTGYNRNLADSAAIAIYVNGRQYETDAISGLAGNNFFPTSSHTITNFRGHGEDLGPDSATPEVAAPIVSFFGKSEFRNQGEFDGEFDEMGIYNTNLNSSQISQIYNNGAPTNLTASTSPVTGNLISWYRAGDVGADNLDADAPSDRISATTSVIRSAVTGATDTLKFTSQNGQDLFVQLKSTSLTGQEPTTIQHPAIIGYQTRSMYDNFFVNHQIPRSSKQYSWITNSIETSINHIGFAPSDFKVINSSRYVDVYDFVSCSEVGSQMNSGNRRFGYTRQEGNQFVPQISDLNINVYEPLSASTNTLGQGNMSTIGYIAYPNGIIDTAPQTTHVAQAFNNLMFKRGNQYGFPSWKQTRQADHPIVRQQRKENKLQTMQNEKINTFVVQPVSFRQRLSEIGIRTVSNDRFKFKTTHRPEYFGTPELDNKLISATADGKRLTPLQALIISAYREPTVRNIDYIEYVEKSFPSARNESFSHSSGRIGYSNDYWHSSRTERNKLDATHYVGSVVTRDPHGPRTGSYIRNSAFGYKVSASCWPLDAQTDFLTRTGPTTFDGNGNPASSVFGDEPYINYAWTSTGSSGELQSAWQSYYIGGSGYANHDISNDPRTFFVTDTRRAMTTIIGPLYARKHMLSSPQSHVNPNSIYNRIAGLFSTGSALSGGISLGYSAPGGPKYGPWDSVRMINRDLFAGEALFESYQQAGYGKMGASGKLEFVPAASKPGYDSYEQFVKSIAKQSRGKALVPEYRISKHLPDYLNYGNVFVEGKHDYFEIPGTNFSSSQDNFYIDYSNADFLKYFADVKESSDLTPTEIKLVCSASIKFHPYKGFFPAQRTIDLTNEFKNSYRDSFSARIANRPDGGGTGGEPLVSNYEGALLLDKMPGAIRPLMQALYSPGILFNSIKSGIAVDYPILYDRYKALVGSHYTNTAYADANGNCGTITPAGTQGSYVPTGSTGTDTYHDYSLCTRTGLWFTASLEMSLAVSTITGWTPGQTLQSNFTRVPGPPASMVQSYGTFWDQRVPFEAILDPNIVANVNFADCEPHPSASIAAVARIQESADKTYSLMAKNFFGGVAEFYLKDSKFSTLESQPVYKDDFKFSDGDVYMARIKLRRSVTGSRDYSFETGSFMPESYNQGGGTALLPRLAVTNDTDAVMYDIGQYFELPQDPLRAPGFYETFTMYSRPTAFGPPVAGHPGIPTSSVNYGGENAGISRFIKPVGAYTASLYYNSKARGMPILDCHTGYNWSFTPPYYNGEAWADLIFRPSGSVSYDLEKILAETKVKYWRVDPGPKIKRYGIEEAFSTGLSNVGISGAINSPSDAFTFDGDISYAGQGYASMPQNGYTTLIHDPQRQDQWGDVNTAPYGGSSINGNAMQISASLNLFGIQRVFKTQTTSMGGMTGVAGSSQNITNEIVGKKWIIGSKFETPMLNFNDKYGLNPVSASLGTKTEPVYGENEAPNGMWHQFGTIPYDEKTGVFMEIQDIPKNWLKNHYDVRLSGSIYNDNTPDYHGNLSKENAVKSLKDLCGFKKSATTSKIGQLKETCTISEAIVAIPYVVETAEQNKPPGTTFSSFNGKYFFRSDESPSLNQPALEYTKTMIEKYILPPQFDYINYPKKVAPIVMYFFEFEYTFDRDDLSYMWQNIMPRNHDKGFFKGTAAVHNLSELGLLNANDILENNNLRWMVFKVKQRVQADYWDYVNAQATSEIVDDLRAFDKDDPSNMKFNWPYDFCSIIEFIDLDTHVLMANGQSVEGKTSSNAYGGSISAEPTLSKQQISGLRVDPMDAVVYTQPNPAHDYVSAYSTAQANAQFEASMQKQLSSTPNSTINQQNQLINPQFKGGDY